MERGMFWLPEAFAITRWPEIRHKLKSHCGLKGFRMTSRLQQRHRAGPPRATASQEGMPSSHKRENTGLRLQQARSGTPGR